LSTHARAISRSVDLPAQDLRRRRGVLHQDGEKSEKDVRVPAGEAQPGEDLRQREVLGRRLDALLEVKKIVRSHPLDGIVERQPRLDGPSGRLSEEAGDDGEARREVGGGEKRAAAVQEPPAESVIVDLEREAAVDREPQRVLPIEELFLAAPFVARHQEQPAR
jgi:hypothetical protein